MDGAELVEIVDALRRVGDDSESVEAKRVGGGFLTASLLRTVSVFANKRYDLNLW